MYAPEVVSYRHPYPLKVSKLKLPPPILLDAPLATALGSLSIDASYRQAHRHVVPSYSPLLPVENRAIASGSSRSNSAPATRTTSPTPWKTAKSAVVSRPSSLPTSPRVPSWEQIYSKPEVKNSHPTWSQQQGPLYVQKSPRENLHPVARSSPSRQGPLLTKKSPSEEPSLTHKSLREEELLHVPRQQLACTKETPEDTPLPKLSSSEEPLGQAKADREDELPEETWERFWCNSTVHPPPMIPSYLYSVELLPEAAQPPSFPCPSSVGFPSVTLPSPSPPTPFSCIPVCRRNPGLSACLLPLRFCTSLTRCPLCSHLCHECGPKRHSNGNLNKPRTISKDAVNPLLRANCGIGAKVLAARKHTWSRHLFVSVFS